MSPMSIQDKYIRNADIKLKQPKQFVGSSPFGSTKKGADLEMNSGLNMLSHINYQSDLRSGVSELMNFTNMQTNLNKEVSETMGLKTIDFYPSKDESESS